MEKKTDIFGNVVTESSINLVWRVNGIEYSAPQKRINDGKVMITYAIV